MRRLSASPGSWTWPRALRRAGEPAFVLAVALAVASAVLVAVGGCGEKIQAPVAKGVPTASLYLEQIPWELTDPTDVLISEGRLLVSEGTPGTVTKYKTYNRESESQADGLRNPVAMALEDIVLVVGEAGVSEAEGPRLTFLSKRTLEVLGSTELSGWVKSLAGVAADPLHVYVSDPDSGAVHRFKWVDGATLSVEPEGLVCNDQGTAESPNFVFEPTGLALDSEDMLLIADADTVRNWVVRFDPTPQGTPTSKGVAVPFRPTSCPTSDLSAFVLGHAPGCGEQFVPGPSAEPGGLHSPQGVTVDSEGRYYVADRGNQRVQRYEPDGRFDLAFGDGGPDGLAQLVRMTPWDGTSPDGQGHTIVTAGARVYVVDRGHNQLRVFEDKIYSDLQGGTSP